MSRLKHAVMAVGAVAISIIVIFALTRRAPDTIRSYFQP